MGSLAGLLLVLVAGAALAQEQPVVVLLDQKQAAYRDTLAGMRSTYKGSLVEVDTGAGNAVAQILQNNPSVVVAIGQQALQQVQGQMKVPVVFSSVLNPGQYNLNAKQVTGVPLEVSPEAQLDLYRLVHPEVRRIAFLYNPAGFSDLAAAAKAAAQKQGLSVYVVPVANAAALPQAVRELSGVDAIWLPPDPSILNRDILSFLLVHCLQQRLALFGFLDDLTRAGALASVSPDYQGIGVQSASLVQAILSRPAPDRTPVPAYRYSDGLLSINLRTATQLGIHVSPEAKKRARKVFE